MVKLFKRFFSFIRRKNIFRKFRESDFRSFVICQKFLEDNPRSNFSLDHTYDFKLNLKEFFDGIKEW